MQQNSFNQKRSESRINIDLTSVFQNAGMSLRVSASAAFESKYQLRYHEKRGTDHYDILWCVRAAVCGDIPGIDLRPKRGKGILIQFASLNAKSNEDLAIAVHTDAQNRVFLSLPEEGWEPPYRVLVAERDKETSDALSRLLSREGYEVITAASAAETFTHVQAEHFDLILVDVDLSDSHGFAVCARLRGIPATKDVPVIICSAWPNASDAAAKVGASGYLEKPLDFIGLPDRLRLFLRPHA